MPPKRRRELEESQDLKSRPSTPADHLEQQELPQTLEYYIKRGVTNQGDGKDLTPEQLKSIVTQISKSDAYKGLSADQNHLLADIQEKFNAACTDYSAAHYLRFNSRSKSDEHQKMIVLTNNFLEEFRKIREEGEATKFTQGGERIKRRKVGESLPGFSNIRTSIEKMDIEDQRTEWQRHISTLPHQYREAETNTMNNTLIPIERGFMIDFTKKNRY